MRAMNDALKNSIDSAQFTVTSFSASDTTLTVQAATDFDVNDVLLIDAELMVIQSVSGLDVVVNRGQLATSAASHAASAPITLIGLQAHLQPSTKVAPSLIRTQLLQLLLQQHLLVAQTATSELTTSI